MHLTIQYVVSHSPQFPLFLVLIKDYWLHSDKFK